MRQLGMFFLSCALSATAIAQNTTQNTLTPQQDLTQFIQEMVTEYHFNSADLTQLFQQVKKNPAVIPHVKAPFEKESWKHYRDFFITPERVALGAAYLKRHHVILEKMQQQYGIPASVIVAILGIETEYGIHLGKFPALSTLYTLSFYYPPREKFFRKELAQYLLLTREDHLPLTTLKGSYAAALGIPQFMPSSYRKFGVSAENKTQVNLFDNNDAIVSVANYFYQMGWKSNQPIAEHLNSKYASFDHKTAKRLYLPLDKQADYWAIYPNFYAIMSYNHNISYAMVVYQLSQAIEKYPNPVNA